MSTTYINSVIAAVLSMPDVPLPFIGDGVVLVAVFNSTTRELTITERK